MTSRQRRLAWVISGLLVLGAATGLVLNALSSNLMFFFTPSQVAAKATPERGSFRMGGLVEEGSLRRSADGMTLDFVVTDLVKRVPVRYRGLLPDLFREGKGVVVAGELQPDGLYVAHQVLAKHDENYMPSEAAEALKQAGATGNAPPPPSEVPQ